MAAYYRRHALSLCYEPAPRALGGIDAISLHITGGIAGVSIGMTVFDEFGDAKRDNPLLIFVLIAHAFGELEDASSFEDWARAELLDATNPAVEACWRENLAAKQVFLENFGSIPDVVSDMDWQLNAGSAQYLRAMTRDEVERVLALPNA